MQTRLARVVVGGFFTISGVSKAFDADGFAAKVSEFGIVADGALGSAAWALIAAELVCGLLCFVRPRAGLRGAILMLLLFLGVLGYGIAIGLDVDCGCLPFGIRESLRVAFARDVVLLVLAWLGLRGAARPSRHRPAAA